MTTSSTTPIYFWVIFMTLIISMLIIDLKFVHKKAHAVSVKEASLWTFFWISLALSFGVGIYFFMGSDKALKFFTGYIIEESLSVDNLFVFLMIFNYFKVPPHYQPRVLHWGIMGAVVMRFIFIFAGVTLINTFHWITYVFGALLIVTGLKTGFGEERKLEPEKNPILKTFKKMMPVASREFVDEKFFVKINDVWHATPLFIVLLLIESSDLVFAVDSIPAILAVTTDTFIVYTSNIFAILGLRALYFLLSSIMPLFVYLKYGISIVLCYVGVKMTIAPIYKIPTLVSLCIVAGVLAGSVLLSILLKKDTPPLESEQA